MLNIVAKASLVFTIIISNS